jgi:hypothetical protein
MQLTEEEKFMVYRMRKIQESWKGRRWVTLILGFLFAGLTVYLMFLEGTYLPTLRPAER